MLTRREDDGGERGAGAARLAARPGGAAPRQATLVALVERGRGRIQQLVADIAAKAAAEHVPHARRRPLQRAHLAPRAPGARPSGAARARPLRRARGGPAARQGRAAGTAAFPPRLGRSAHRTAGSMAKPRRSLHAPPEKMRTAGARRACPGAGDQHRSSLQRAPVPSTRRTSATRSMRRGRLWLSVHVSGASGQDGKLPLAQPHPALFPGPNPNLLPGTGPRLDAGDELLKVVQRQQLRLQLGQQRERDAQQTVRPVLDQQRVYHAARDRRRERAREARQQPLAGVQHGQRGVGLRSSQAPRARVSGCGLRVSGRATREVRRAGRRPWAAAAARGRSYVHAPALAQPPRNKRPDTRRVCKQPAAAPGAGGAPAPRGPPAPPFPTLPYPEQARASKCSFRGRIARSMSHSSMRSCAFRPSRPGR